MPKKNPKTKPRLVVYPTDKELAQCEIAARESGDRTPHLWLASLMRKELNRLNFSRASG